VQNGSNRFPDGVDFLVGKTQGSECRLRRFVIVSVADRPNFGGFALIDVEILLDISAQVVLAQIGIGGTKKQLKYAANI
jgi:hypothetical protein